MYDYLAKVILLGPSGSGKSVGLIAVDCFWAYDTQVLPVASVREERMSVSSPVMTIWQVADECCRARSDFSDYWCRVRLQDHQSRDGLPTSEGQITIMGYGRD